MEPEQDSGIGASLRTAAERLLRLAEDKLADSPEAEPEAGIDASLPAEAERPLTLAEDPESANLPAVAAEAAASGDEVVVVEEWVESAEGGEESVLGWHGNPLIGWYRTDAVEGRDPNVGPTPRPGGPKPGSPRPGGPRPGVRPSGPPVDLE